MIRSMIHLMLNSCSEMQLQIPTLVPKTQIWSCQFSALSPLVVSHSLQKPTRSKKPRQALCTKSSNFIHFVFYALKETFTHNTMGMAPLELGSGTSPKKKLRPTLLKGPRENPQAWLWRGKHMKFEIRQACTWLFLYVKYHLTLLSICIK